MSKAGTLRLRDYLGHIREAIERCRRYVDDMDEAAFLQDQKTQDAVIRTFEVIGEASSNIIRHYPDFSAAHPDLPFGFAYEMRNALAHGYFKVDLAVVWRTIHADLPPLQERVDALLASKTVP